MSNRICSEKHGYLSINLCESFSVSQSVAPVKSAALHPTIVASMSPVWPTILPFAMLTLRLSPRGTLKSKMGSKMLQTSIVIQKWRTTKTGGTGYIGSHAGLPHHHCQPPRQFLGARTPPHPTQMGHGGPAWRLKEEMVSHVAWRLEEAVVDGGGAQRHRQRRDTSEAEGNRSSVGTQCRTF
jgi:hypothetical protein